MGFMFKHAIPNGSCGEISRYGEKKKPYVFGPNTSIGY